MPSINHGKYNPKFQSDQNRPDLIPTLAGLSLFANVKSTREMELKCVSLARWLGGLIAGLASVRYEQNATNATQHVASRAATGRPNDGARPPKKRGSSAGPLPNHWEGFGDRNPWIDFERIRE
jgi:hypothetical protein